MATGAVTDKERRPFDELVAGWRNGHPQLTISAEAVVAHPAAALVEASRNAQLLVVGTHGRGAVRGLIPGSVSRHLPRHSVCTVAVANGEWRSRPATPCGV
ncbi:universal stress protein [Actinoplanes sp. NPDC048796]|uniref:universal stress protein n=1 Tax=Actinoplanes sp. NPDC048796 TaxID=3155640 RepID=UPI0033F0EB70